MSWTVFIGEQIVLHLTNIMIKPLVTTCHDSNDDDPLWTKDKLSLQWSWPSRITKPSSTLASPTFWSISNHSPIWLVTATTAASRLMGFITKTVDVFIGQDSRSLDSLFPHSTIQEDDGKGKTKLFLIFMLLRVIHYQPGPNLVACMKEIWLMSFWCHWHS